MQCTRLEKMQQQQVLKLDPLFLFPLSSISLSLPLFLALFVLWKQFTLIQSYLISSKLQDLEMLASFSQ